MSQWLKIVLWWLKYCLPVPVFHFWPKLTHAVARSLCDSWATYWPLAWATQTSVNTAQPSLIALLPYCLKRIQSYGSLGWAFLRPLAVSGALSTVRVKNSSPLQDYLRYFHSCWTYVIKNYNHIPTKNTKNSNNNNHVNQKRGSCDRITTWRPHYVAPVVLDSFWLVLCCACAQSAA